MQLTDTPEWHALTKHYKAVKDTHLSDLFSDDPSRADYLSVQAADIYADLSKNRVTATTIELLITLAKARNVEQQRDDMFSGKKINATENRAVLHTALRSSSTEPLVVDGEDVRPNIAAVLEKMKQFSTLVRDGVWHGHTGKRIRHVVNIGIGGSDLGPVMATTALQHYATNELKVHFVSNIDGTHMHETLKHLNPEETLFIIASKTFTTDETMTNAATARTWLLEALHDEVAIRGHFVALSTNTEAVEAFGINPDNMFEFWDWVGGRYSLCSAIGLSVMIAIGPDNFQQLLDGFEAMDEHFKTAPLEQNLPTLMALIGVWYGNFFHASSEAILPYDQYLSRFPAYFQQGNMESNGKHVTKSGHIVTHATGPVIWGEPGTNGQHAFYQLLHQGTHLVPIDFIGTIKPLNSLSNHHRKLTANLLAQSQALAFGKLEEQLRSEGIDEALIPHKSFSGNRPSNTLLIPELTPHTLGQLIALYEHKIFVQGVIWDINSFDQWGVELGKALASEIHNNLKSGTVPENADSSTQALIKKFIS